jgi:hypothetical protein
MLHWRESQKPKRVPLFVRGPAKQVNDQGNDGKKQKQVDQQARDMVDEKSARPEQEQNHKYG